MNIFTLDQMPVLAAQYHCDRHVCKMVIEAAQLICTALIHQGIPSKPTDDIQWQPNTIGYKATHSNHPCSLWVRKDPANMAWLFEHFQELCAEYTRRYQRVHLVEKKMQQIYHYKPAASSSNHTPFAQAMPDVYKQDDAVLAYRAYYIGDKARFAKWKLGNIPFWWS